MLPGIHALLELSRVDMEIAALEEEKATLPGAREALAVNRSEAAAGVEAAEAALGEAEQEQRRHESVMADREALVAKLEGQQHQVKTNEAYTALLHEIEQAREGISEAETAILEAMEGIEVARAALERAKALLAEADASIAADGAKIDDREKSLDQSLGNLRREREGHASGVDAATMATYERTVARRRPAVALVKGEMCMACRVGLPPQAILEMRKGERVITCGSCRRILIFEAPSEAS